MKITLFAYSKNGMETGRRIMSALDGEFASYAVERLAGGDFLPLPKPAAPAYKEAFSASDALIFVSSCGIAVRSVAPYVRSKTEDPAVIVADDAGRFVISLLSGHIGGANALAEKIAAAIGAVPVITTATDVNGRFSVDTWAKNNGFAIADMQAAKAVSAAILEADVLLTSVFPIIGGLPKGVVSGQSGQVGISLSYLKEAPFGTTLRLIPKCLSVGVGCRRGTGEETIARAIARTFDENDLDARAVKRVASIDLKQDEPGLISFCEKAGIPLRFYSAEQLNEVEGEFTPSRFVRETTGVDNVCERAAMIGAEKLLVKKTAADGVTVAVALIKMEVCFE